MNSQKNMTSADFLQPEEMTAEGDVGFNLLDFVRVLRVRRKIILGTAAAVVALVTVIVMQMTPLYSSTAVVMLNQQTNNIENTAAVLSGLPTGDQATIENQVQILTSLELAGRVVDKQKLIEDPEFNPKRKGLGALLALLNPLHWVQADPKIQADALGQDLERNSIIHALQSRLTVTPIGLSTAMKVTFESTNPGNAASIANAFANAYVEDQLEAKFEATRKATQWLSERISDLSRQAQAAEAAVQQYKAENNITTTSNGVSVVDQQIADLNNQLVLAKTDLAEKQASYGRLEALAESGQGENAPQVVASPLISTLRAQEMELTRQIADLSSKYGPRHPKMLDLQAQKANLDTKIGEEVQRIVIAGRNEVAASQARVASLQSSLHQLEAEGAGQNQVGVKLTALQSAATSARAMYEAFLGRLDQTQNQQGIQTPDARIISVAEMPTSASYPNKKLTIGIAIPAGFILGLMLAFVAERLDAGFKTAMQLEKLLGIPVLSTIPEVKGQESTPIDVSDLIVDRPMSSFAEAIRGLQMGISLAHVDQPPKVILLTSPMPGEGKTTLSLALARIAVRTGLKTLVIDGDLRRPHIFKTLRVDTNPKGIIEALKEKKSIEQYLFKDPRSDVMVLACSEAPKSPADLLSSQAMTQLIDNLRGAFDLIIIDSAPILPVHDTKLLCRLVDAVLFVIRWEKTPREAAVNALRSLADVHAPVVGVALTRADNERFRYYSYGYQNYYNYSRYYND